MWTSYRSPMPRKLIPVGVEIEGPYSATCQGMSSSMLKDLLTEAASDERLKKPASNKAGSSPRKWPPITFV